MEQRLTRFDFRFLIVCGVLFAASLAFVIFFFDQAFPEASIEFRIDRRESRRVATTLLSEVGLDPSKYRHAYEFDSDNTAKIFLERTLGLARANQVMSTDVQVWYWRHRWFRPLQTEEFHVDVSPRGEVIGFSHRLPENAPAPAVAANDRRAIGEAFLQKRGIAISQLDLVSISERKLPKRTDSILTWERRAPRPGGAPYRYMIVLQGSNVGAFAQGLKVPDQWKRDYADLRAKNSAAGTVDSIFNVITILALLVVFIARLRRGDIQIRFSLLIGLICTILSILVGLNSLPSALAQYDTQTSLSAFIVQELAGSAINGIALGMFLMVLVGGGETMHRERFPEHLAIPRLFTRAALKSKRVFKGLVLGYTLVPLFIAYQVAFYLIAERFGAWSPAEVPYDSILNSVIPWATVLFIGFFPAFSEEYLSRAFSIPFFEKLLRSKVAAILIAAFIWGFAHSAYPNQPFFIRGLEVGIAGTVIGFLFYPFGLLPLLVWHYTVDALYTALLLFRSSNPYFIFSAGLASLIFVLPLGVSVWQYLRTRTFEPDDELTNGAIGSIPAPEETEIAEPAPLPPAPRLTKLHVMAAAAAIAVAAVLIVIRNSGATRVSNYRITGSEAKAVAREHLTSLGVPQLPTHSVATPSRGFRRWIDSASDGGSPGSYDDVAARYIAENSQAPIRELAGIQKNSLEAATWVVRFFTPKQKEELFVEIDPRTRKVVGFDRALAETAKGAKLERPQAESIARSSFTRYGIDVSAFEMKEALSFQQPSRRDWVFHFQERSPLKAQAFRRVNIRVAGDQLTHFGETIWIPEVERKARTQKTFLRTILMLLRIAAAIVLMVFVTTGFVSAFRTGDIRWRASLRWGILFGVTGALVSLTALERALASYDTSTEFQTFMVQTGVAMTGILLFKALTAAVAVIVIDTIGPTTSQLLSRSAAARFGRGSVVAVLTITGVLASTGALTELFARAFPRLFAPPSPQVSELVAISLPALSALWDAAFAALVGSAAVLAFAHLLESSQTERNRRTVELVTIVAIALVFVDGSLPVHLMPVNILFSIIGAAIFYAAARYILGRRLLAYPLAIFAALVLSPASTLLRHDRVDLRVNGVVMLAVLGGILLLLALQREKEVTE